MIFVDTSAWFASVVPSDSDYAAASSWLGGNTEPLLTTDYVMDETLALLKFRGESLRTLSLGKEFFRGTLTEVYYLTEIDIKQTWETFQQYSDKDWSFTDCASKVVIEKLRLTHALWL
jgi:uncharacterized protein